MLKTFFLTLIIVAFLGGLFLSFAYGLNETEKIECLHWRKQASEIVGFYLTEAEAEQCEHHNIEIVFTI